MLTPPSVEEAETKLSTADETIAAIDVVDITAMDDDDDGRDVFIGVDLEALEAAAIDQAAKQASSVEQVT
eukprot:COSAG01_NODE_29726_length_631_cov_0.746241_1_plen_70_part_00